MPDADPRAQGPAADPRSRTVGVPELEATTARPGTETIGADGAEPVGERVSAWLRDRLHGRAGGSATADWTVSLDTCDAVTAPAEGTAPVVPDPMLSDELGLAALAGPGLPPDLTGFEPPSGPYLEQLQPLGVPLSREAATALTEALVRACGGLSPPAVRVTQGSTRVTLAYGILDPDQRCLPYGGALPRLDLAVEVPDGDAVRTVHYTASPAVGVDRAAVRLLCRNP